MSNPTELPDLDKLEALARAAKSEVRSPRIENQCASEYDLAMAMDSDTVLALIALARKALEQRHER